MPTKPNQFRSSEKVVFRLNVLRSTYLTMNIDNLFSQPNIRESEEYVISLQRQLDRAIVEGDKKQVHRLFDLLTKRSEAVKILAVNKITRINQGKYTAGIDGISIPRDRTDANNFRYKLLNQIDLRKKPDNIKRVFIPKSDGKKKRPLGIPTIADRIVQEIIRTGLEPIVEYNFHNNSYGFRPNRSCQDAMVHLYKKLSNPKSPKYVVEGDIEGCFDNIKHSYILRTLDFWGIPNWTTEIIAEMLKSSVLYENKVYANKAGTPQGGVISPMLANVALTSLDYHCQNFAKHTNPIVRYADDFVIVCLSEKEGLKIKAEITDFLNETSGLKLSDEKTAITHISKGFNFLGFNFKKYKPNGTMRNWTKTKLLIKPQPEKVKDFLRNISKEIRKRDNLSQADLLAVLNPKIKGFVMYYRHCVSQTTFNKIDHKLWFKLLKWGKRKYRKYNTEQVISKCFHRTVNNDLIFRDAETGSKISLAKIMPIRRFNKVKEGYRVFDGSEETIKYWTKRNTENCLYALTVKTRRTLYERQKGNCYYCNYPFILNEILDSEVHVHHVKPKAMKGTNKLDNLRLIHKHCHNEIHSKSSMDFDSTKPFIT